MAELTSVIDRALEDERSDRLPGVRHVRPEEIAFQRRASLLLTVVPLVGVVAAIVLLWGRGISLVDFTLFLGFYILTVIGVTVGFHRLFTHRGFTAPAPLRVVLAIAGSMAVQGSVIEWVATHRRHHAYADEFGDPHSPHLVEHEGLRGVLHGLWHAHVGWLFRPGGTVTSRWAPDLEAERPIAAIDRAFPVLVILSFTLPAAIGGVVTWSLAGALTGFIWGSLVRMFVLHHVTWSINSICHFFGTQPFDSRDESRNNWPLSVISFGESWHNNHHAFPTSARHGLLRWQVDPSWRVIRTLEQLRIVRDVRLPTAEQMARRRSRVAPSSTGSDTA